MAFICIQVSKMMLNFTALALKCRVNFAFNLGSQPLEYMLTRIEFG